MRISELEQEVAKRLSGERFEHSIRVAKTAEQIAARHNLDTDKAYISGLLHDIAREMTTEELANKLKQNNIVLNPDEQNCPGIWHMFSGAIIAKEELNIIDEDILDAIRFHSSGDPTMSDIAKTVYLADIIEPNRKDWEDSKEALANISDLAKRDINQAMLAGLAFKIHLSLKKGTLILQRSIELWNQLVNEQKKL